MDRRVVAGLALGLTGLAAGIVASVEDSSLLGLLAGGCALATVGVVLALADALHRRQRNLASVREGLTLLQAEVASLQQAAAVGCDAVRVAGTFAQMVAVRNIELTQQAEGGLVDQPTGLLDARYFQPALQDRVASARRLLQPVSLVLLELDPRQSEEQRQRALTTFANVLRATLREADTACRIGGSRFALILEETPEGGGVWAAERLRTEFARQGGDVRQLSAGVASYPSHALDAEELLHGAERALQRARANGRGQVEVAPVE